MRDWKDCIKDCEAKQINPDIEMASSLLKISKNKLISAKELILREETAASKVSLNYDSVRELLEAIALIKGFKIYNHVCYVSFLKEILNLPDIADEFNSLRIIRNDINYYGKEISIEESEDVIKRLIDLHKELVKYKDNFINNQKSA